MRDLKDFSNHVINSKLLLLGFIIYFLFNISALKTHWFDYFFFGSSIHYCCKGLDFYGIPNGVYSFWHGGDLSGGNLLEGLKPYSGNIPSNPNDYHPLTSLTVGTFLILFEPKTSFNIWIIMKIVITLFASFYIFKNFKDNKYLNLALFIFLINFSQYNEIRISQYQFIFNIFLLIFLIKLVKNKDNFENAILYFLTLIAKPISLLLIPVLLIKRLFTTAIFGFFIFIISSLSFYAIGVGEHFTNNLLHHLINPRVPDSIDFMSLNALMNYPFNLSNNIMVLFKYSLLLGIYLISLSKKTNILLSVFLLTVYFLFFYDNLFQYHFSILGPVLAICLLKLPEFQTKISRFLIIIISLPNVFFILRILNYQFIFDPIYGPNPTMHGWQIVNFLQLLPVILLTIVVLIQITNIKFQKKYFR